MTKSMELSLMAMFTTLYLALGLVFAPISFMGLQVRVAQCLIPLIALFGAPAVNGLFVGHVLMNLWSPLGFLDMLSPLILIIPKILIMKRGIRYAPLHVLTVGLWVGYMLHYILGLPLIQMILQVVIGETIAELGLGLLVYRGVKKWLGTR